MSQNTHINQLHGSVKIAIVVGLSKTKYSTDILLGNLISLCSYIFRAKDYTFIFLLLSL